MSEYTFNGVDYEHFCKVLYAKAVRGENVGNVHPYLLSLEEERVDYSDIVFGADCRVRMFESL